MPNQALCIEPKQKISSAVTVTLFVYKSQDVDVFDVLMVFYY